MLTKDFVKKVNLTTYQKKVFYKKTGLSPEETMGMLEIKDILDLDISKAMKTKIVFTFFNKNNGGQGN
ncbi:MAG: hypothetical protein WC827_04705 [Candidatus Paceibacterota bacterium]